MNRPYLDQLDQFLDLALLEDVGEGDHTSLSTISLSKKGEAKLLIKDEGIFAGMDEAVATFKKVDGSLEVSPLISDGDIVKPGDIACLASGSVHSILKAERVLLNIVQRMSGIATVTRQIVDALAGTKTKVLDTRKTTPLLRFLEKKAVTIGGGINHRFGLYDMILIKDNHIDYAGGISQAIEAANLYRSKLSRKLEIEIEVRSFQELEQVLKVGKVERIMLDNFTPTNVREAVERINGQYITEASGGISLETCRAYAEAGVDFISMGSLTHSVKSMDISLLAKSVD